MPSRTCDTCGRPVANQDADSCPSCASPLGSTADRTAVLPGAVPPGDRPEYRSAAAGEPATGAPEAPPGSTRVAHQPPGPSVGARGGSNRPVGRGLSQLFGTTVGPAGVVVAVAAAAALALPGTIYAFFAEEARSGGAKATVVLLMLLLAGAAVAATVFAARRTRAGEDRVVASLAVGFGVFASTLAILQMLTAAAK
jgi:hypothetical protein